MKRAKIKLTKEGKYITAGAAAGILLLALLLFFSMFRVDKVYVIGSTRYTDEEVKEYVMTSPLTSNTVLAMLFQRHKDAGNLAFVESFDLERVNAHTIRIHVNEKNIVGYLTQGMNRLYFNKDGEVVEITAMEQDEIEAMEQEEAQLEELKAEADREEARKRAEEAKKALLGEDVVAALEEEEKALEEETGEESEGVLQPEEIQGEVLQAVESDASNENATKFKAAVTDVPRIIGITTEGKQIEFGEKIQAVTDQVFNTILGITRMVEKYEILPEMVFFNEEQEITLVYNGGKIHCNLGKDTLLEEKITRVAAILPKLSEFTGVLHLEDYTTDITNIIFSKESLYTLKMEIAQIEGKVTDTEEMSAPAADAETGETSESGGNSVEASVESDGTNETEPVQSSETGRSPITE